MFWGAFSQEYGRSDLVVMKGYEMTERGGVTAWSYVNVLKEHLPTVLGKSRTFMQDNAPIHTAQIVKNWLQEEDIRLLDWPPYSPDLNPMENLWGPLKRGIYKQDRGLLKARGSGSDVQERLIVASCRS